ncbi:MAG: hypothetical protein QOG70_2962 [Solirubrobacteraceae bacterium]|jgi:hypothetical protein|nr:hypothetical protein [Solirubrobacteraceae bacterium]
MAPRGKRCDHHNVDLFVLDDALRSKPERAGMGPLYAVGGLYIPSAQVGGLERGLDELCAEFEFPPGEEFKWSPGRELWMREGLKEAKRRTFYLRALELAQAAEAKALVVIADGNKGRATSPTVSPEEDVVTMFLERAHNHLQGTDTEALVLTDRPGGVREDENKFLASCLATMRHGTKYVLPTRLTLVVATQSRLVRLLQLADVVVSSTLARVGGEPTYAPPVFEAVKPMIRVGGGWGLKIHPDFRYMNLYHWLLGEDAWISRQRYAALPAKGRAYAESPDHP